MRNNVIMEYAEAIFAIAKEEDKQDKVFSDLTLVKEIFEKDADYILLLSSPNISREEKLAAIDEAFLPYVDEDVLSLLKLLCEAGRIGGFYLLYEDFSALYRISKNLILAEVISAVPLTEGEKAKLTRNLEAKYNTRVEINYTLDPSILGGIIVKTEDDVIDGSLKTRLQGVKEVIKS